MAGVTAAITSPDLAKQVKLLGIDNVNRVVNKHAFPAMQMSVRSMLAGWKDVAAVDTGFYKGTLKMEIKSLASGRILQGSVKTFAISPGGFPYPRALEDSVRYHYRSTRRQGRRTAGQVVKMYLARIKVVRKLFIKASDLIVKDLAVK
jgi:hypothetical protein